jgi:hypothetical protein
MLSRRNMLLLLAGAAVFFTGTVCGLGSAPVNSVPPAATSAAFSTPSGGGGGEPTKAVAPTSFAIIIMPTATAGAAALPTSVAQPVPAIPESRRVTLEYPPRIRSGDSDVVRLTLEVDALGNITPTAETPGNVVTGQTVQIPNLYDTHNVIAEARLDLAGVDVRPSEEVNSPLLPGQSVTFYWSVRPNSSGTFRGTAWLFLRFIDKVTKEESRIPLSAQPLAITTAEFLGLSGGLARAAGGVGSIVGAVLGFPFAGDILKWLWKRVRQGG